jgi:alcohol dehydrogenase class IV
MLTRLAFEQDIVDARKVQQSAQQQASRSSADNHNLGPHHSLPHKNQRHFHNDHSLKRATPFDVARNFANLEMRLHVN